MKMQRERHGNVTRHTQPLSLGEKRMLGQHVPQVDQSAIAAAVRGNAASVHESGRFLSLKGHKRASKHSSVLTPAPLDVPEPLPVPVGRWSSNGLSSLFFFLSEFSFVLMLMAVTRTALLP